MLTLCKKFVHRENHKPVIGRKISSFQQELEKIDPRSINFIYSKSVRVSTLESFSAKGYSNDTVQNTGIVNRSRDYGNAGQSSHKKVEYYISGQFLSNILLVKKKDGGIVHV